MPVGATRRRRSQCGVGSGTGGGSPDCARMARGVRPDINLRRRRLATVVAGAESEAQGSRRRAKPSRAIRSTATFAVSRPCRPTSTVTDYSASIYSLLSCYIVGFYRIISIFLSGFGRLANFDAQSANVQNAVRDAARKRGS